MFMPNSVCCSTERPDLFQADIDTNQPTDIMMLPMCNKKFLLPIKETIHYIGYWFLRHDLFLTYPVVREIPLQKINLKPSRKSAKIRG